MLWIHTDIHLRRLYLKLPAVDEVLRVKEFFPFKILLTRIMELLDCLVRGSALHENFLELIDVNLWSFIGFCFLKEIYFLTYLAMKGLHDIDITFVL